MPKSRILGTALYSVLQEPTLHSPYRTHGPGSAATVKGYFGNTVANSLERAVLLIPPFLTRTFGASSATVYRTIFVWVIRRNLVDWQMLIVLGWRIFVVLITQSTITLKKKGTVTTWYTTASRIHIKYTMVRHHINRFQNRIALFCRVKGNKVVTLHRNRPFAVITGNYPSFRK